jgi:EAL and modified HD-GYP domain-containing signal transduction protein
MEHIFIGRQPILDADGVLDGYELLHRRAGEDRTTDVDGDRMSSELLLNAVLEIGIQAVCGGHRSFINVTRNLLMSTGLDALPSDKIVLEVLETVTVDPPLLERLRGLRARHFQIALDDYVCLPDRDPLLAHADIVKLDVLALDEAALERQVALLRDRPLRLLAEKVETPAMYQKLRAMGFHLFQGYFFAKPEIYRGQRIRPNKLVVLELLARVHEQNIMPEQLAVIIRGDVALSVTVLRWANGSIYGMRHAVGSVERAIVVLGLQTVRNWVSLLALARLGTSPNELLTVLLVRARTCELLANAAERANASLYFTVGLLSALDIILQVDMAVALERMPLSAEQKSALFTHSGELGEALNAVIACERGEAARARFASLAENDIVQCYLSGLAWADSLSSAGV